MFFTFSSGKCFDRMNEFHIYIRKDKNFVDAFHENTGLFFWEEALKFVKENTGISTRRSGVGMDGDLFLRVHDDFFDALFYSDNEIENYYGDEDVAFQRLVMDPLEKRFKEEWYKYRVPKLSSIILEKLRNPTVCMLATSHVYRAFFKITDKDPVLENIMSLLEKYDIS
jgi:hypothetical protein